MEKKVNKGLQQTYRAAGSIHQAFGALHPDAGEDRKFAQLYMNDPTDQDDARDARFDCLKKKDIKLVRNLLETYNPYVQLFKLNRHTLNHNQEYKVVLKNVSKESYNRYQAPSVDEVGGILDEKTGHLPMQVVLEKKKLKNGKPKFSFAKHHNSYYDAVRYLLMFPKGEQGWHKCLKTRNGARKLTQKEFYRFHCFERPENKENYPITRTGPLAQQYWVDQGLKLEHSGQKIGPANWARKLDQHFGPENWTTKFDQ